MEKLIAEFDARSDDSQTFRIMCYEDQREVQTRGGTQQLPGRKRLITSHGLPVNRVAKGVYQIVLLNLEVKSDDPNAI